jgi:hypothetical protein
VAQSVADTGAAVMLPQPLLWSLPPVGLAWLRTSPKAAIVSDLVNAMRQAC